MNVRTLFLIGLLLSGTDALAEMAAPPEIKMTGADSFVYRAQGKRDPFQPPVAAVPDESANPRPQKNRREKEFLESFQLDSLKLVAILFDAEAQGWAPSNRDLVAMVEDPDGIGHIIRVGSYMGVNEGRVVRIRDGEVVIEEPATKPNDSTRTTTLPWHKTEEPGRDDGPTKTNTP